MFILGTPPSPVNSAASFRPPSFLRENRPPRAGGRESGTAGAVPPPAEARPVVPRAARARVAPGGGGADAGAAAATRLTAGPGAGRVLR
jgi:hypothetical protein